jgi:hypothetical protein
VPYAASAFETERRRALAARSPSRRIAAAGADQREVVIDQVVSTVDVSAQANIAQALAWRATHYPLEHAADLPDDILGRNFRDVLAKKPALEPGTVEYDRLLCILIDVDEQGGPEASALLEAR